MPIGEVSAATTASAYNVTLQNKQADQQEKVVGTMLASATHTSPPQQTSSPPSNKLLNVTA